MHEAKTTIDSFEAIDVQILNVGINNKARSHFRDAVGMESNKYAIPANAMD